MAAIISVANQKGGCGKTTTTMHVAGALADRGCNVMVVDADPQASIYQCVDESKVPFKILPVTQGLLQKELMRLATADEHDVIVVDCPPGVANDATLVAMSCSNVTLVPLLTGKQDYFATQPFIDTAAVAVQRNPNLRILVFINKKKHTRIGRQAHESALNSFSGKPNVTVLDCEVPDAALIEEAIVAGTTVFHYKPARGSKALRAYAQLTEEVLTCLMGTETAAARV